MGIKLSELYNSCDKKNFKLIAGEKNINNSVSWIHMVEGMEITQFVEPNELSFTTGIAIENEEELFELVKSSYHSNATGFVINIGPFISRIPEEIINFCNEHDFPLFEMPWHVHLAEIMRKFCYQITLAERVEIELSSAIKNALFFPSQKDSYMPQLERYGFKSENSYCISIIEIFDSNNLPVIDMEKQLSLLKKIENALIFNSNGICSLIIENKFVILFSGYEELEVKNVYIQNLKRLKENLGINNKFFISIGNKVKKIEDLGKTYKNALNVLKLKKSENFSNEDIVLYSDLGLYKVILSVEDKQILKEFYDENLKSIIKYDELNETDYMKVLESYLRNNGSVKAVSQELFYHKNTICYKINKIEEILNIDFSDFKIRSNLYLSILIKNYIT